MKIWAKTKEFFEGKFLVDRRVEIPTKSAMHSKTKPATNSELKPAGVPI